MGILQFGIGIYGAGSPADVDVAFKIRFCGHEKLDYHSTFRIFFNDIKGLL